MPIEVALADLGISGEMKIRDLWTHTEAGTAKGSFSRWSPSTARASSV